ncbi:Protein-L-isoaspartate O-methyltransferase [hydrothermal vent metagenome]|uniref:protein-L-isoaspartate(D-aspartate) O-methyltransferase n=1 Tax=hydrothermal vent metagenome TaxID=652676 RepID=A0A3B0YZQ1_9ZZZZ
MSRHQGIGMTSQRTRDRLISRLESGGIRSLEVLDAMRATPRHIFVDEALASRAYEDTALPIGYSQTISQPYIVAKMSEVLLLSGPLNKVLEIGTGSGYQAAILALLVKEVYSIERIEPLIRQARARFQELTLRNIRLQFDDGTLGWPEYGPYDGIIATAAPLEVPMPLLEQLVLGGRLIIPIGKQGVQRLMLYTRTEEGVEEEFIEQVSFVPMLSGQKK